MPLVHDIGKARLKPATVLLTAARETASLGNKEVAGGQTGGQKRHAPGRAEELRS